MNKSPIVIKQNTRTLVSSEKSNGLRILDSSFGLYSLEAMGYLVAVFLLLQCCSYSQYSSFSVGLWDAAHNHFSQPVPLSFFRALQILLHFPSESILPSLLFQCHLRKTSKQIYSHTAILKYIYCF